jgi:hypothetical protein
MQAILSSLLNSVSDAYGLRCQIKGQSSLQVASVAIEAVNIFILMMKFNQHTLWFHQESLDFSSNSVRSSDSLNFFCWGVRPMFHKCWLLHDEINGLNTILGNETGVIMVVKVVWIGQTMVIQYVWFSRVNSHRIGYFIHPFDQSVRQLEDADSYHCMVAEMLIDNSSPQVLLDAPVRLLILLLTRQWWP